MKLTKMLGLAAVAAVAAAAFVGVGTSAAAKIHPLIALCLAAELLLCANANRITEAQLETGLLLAIAGPGELVGALSEKCQKSMGRVAIDKTTGGETNKAGMLTPNAAGTFNELMGNIVELTFAECTPCNSVTTTASEAAPFPIAAQMPAAEAEEEKGALTAEGKGQALIKGGIGCLGNECEFEAKELNPKPKFEMMAAPEEEELLNTNETVLKRIKGGAFCGETGKWVTKYKLRWTLFKDKAHKEKIAEHKIWLTLVESPCLNTGGC